MIRIVVFVLILLEAVTVAAGVAREYRYGILSVNNSMSFWVQRENLSMEKYAFHLARHANLDTELRQFCEDYQIDDVSCHQLREAYRKEFIAPHDNDPRSRIPDSVEEAHLSLSEKLSLKSFVDMLVPKLCHDNNATAMLQILLKKLSPSQRRYWKSSSPVSDIGLTMGHWRNSRTIGIPCMGSEYDWVSRGSWYPIPVLGSAGGIGLTRCQGAIRIAPECDVNSMVSDSCVNDHTPLCDEFVSDNDGGQCALYSFGTADMFIVEEVYHAEGCEVHAFDPTDRFKQHNEAHAKQIGPNFHFHFLGIGRGSSTATNFGFMHGHMLSLAEIHSRFAGREITVLKMDCEGCEWKALHEIVTETPELLSKVHTIILEIHIETTHQVTTSSDLRLIASFYDKYISEMGFKMAYLHEFGLTSHHNVHPVLIELGLHEDICCYEVILHRNLQ